MASKPAGQPPPRPALVSQMACLTSRPSAGTTTSRHAECSSSKDSSRQQQQQQQHHQQQQQQRQYRYHSSSKKGRRTPLSTQQQQQKEGGGSCLAESTIRTLTRRYVVDRDMYTLLFLLLLPPTPFLSPPLASLVSLPADCVEFEDGRQGV